MVRNTYLSYERLLSYKLIVLVVDGNLFVVRSLTSVRGYASQVQTRFHVIVHVTIYSVTTDFYVLVKPLD